MNIQKTSYTTPNVTFNGSIGKEFKNLIQNNIDCRIKELKLSTRQNPIDSQQLEMRKEHIKTLTNYYYKFKDFVQQIHPDIELNYKDSLHKSLLFRDKITGIEKEILNNFGTIYKSDLLSFIPAASKSIFKDYPDTKTVNNIIFDTIVEDTQKVIENSSPFANKQDKETCLARINDLEKRWPGFVEKSKSDQAITKLKCLLKKQEIREEKILKEIEELEKSTRLD